MSEIRDGIYSATQGQSVELVSVRDREIVSKCNQSLRMVTRMHGDAWSRAWGTWEASLGEGTTESEDAFLSQHYPNGEFDYLGDWTE